MAPSLHHARLLGRADPHSHSFFESPGEAVHWPLKVTRQSCKLSPWPTKVVLWIRSIPLPYTYPQILMNQENQPHLSSCFGQTDLSEKLAGRKQMFSSPVSTAVLLCRSGEKCRGQQRTEHCQMCWRGLGRGSHRRPWMQSTGCICQLQHLSYFIFF